MNSTGAFYRLKKSNSISKAWSQNYRIWATENPFTHALVLFHSMKVAVWCKLMVLFIVGSSSFQEMDPEGPVTCTINCKCYDSILRYQIIPTFQQGAYRDRIIFMKDCTPPQIEKPVMHLLKKHFENDEIISCRFPILWTSKSQDHSTYTSGFGVIFKMLKLDFYH